MRSRSLLVAFATLAAGIAVATTSAPAQAAGGCTVDPKTGYVWRCDHTFPTARQRGSIALLGDSVLLGSSPSVSSPSLPDLLAAKGWGPVRMTTALGMRSTWTIPEVSGLAVLDKWRSQGVDPVVVGVNLGANYLGTCSPSTVANCKQYIDMLVNRILTYWPNATIWWAKVVQRSGPSLSYTDGMKGWNLALDLAAKQHPGRMIAWDWPTALASSGIATDVGGIHPSSAKEYVKRSTLIANNLASTIRSTYLGPRAKAPASVGTGLAYVPHPNARELFAGGLTAGTTKSLDLTAVLPAGAGAVAVGITSAKPTGAGYVTLFPCGTAVPQVSSLNFVAGQARSAQAIVRLGAGETLCARASVGVTVRIALQGTFVGGAAGVADTLHLLAPKRLVNTTNTNTTVTRTITIAETSLAGRDLDAVALNVVVDKASAPGNLSVYRCDAPAVPAAANLSFAKGETVAGAVFAPLSATDQVCVRVRIAAGSTFRLVVDRSGVFTKDESGSRFLPVTPKRMLDTRAKYRTGGWFGRHQVQQTVDVIAGYPGAVGASGTLTMVNPATTGYLTATGCGALPPTSTVNGRPGAAAASTATSAVDAQGRMCIYASTNTDTVFDIAGWWQQPLPA